MRLATGGRIDRTRPLTYTLDGVARQGFAGDTLASALLADGVRRVGDSIYRRRPRGVLTAGITEPNAFVQVMGPFAEPITPATVVPLVDGLLARTLSGVGRLDPAPSTARYDRVHRHVETLVVGGGASGVQAARQAARSGDRVVLVDAGTDAPEIPGVDVLRRTRAFGHYDHGLVLAVEHRTDHLGAEAPKTWTRQRVWHLRARDVVHATGLIERPLVFPGNDRPGVMLAGAVRAYVERWAVVPGSAAAVFTVDDSAYATALALVAAGVPVQAIVDARPVPPAALAEEAAALGIPVLTEALVDTTIAGADGTLAGVRVRSAVGDHTVEATLDVDLLAVCGGHHPDLHLFGQARGTSVWDDERVAYRPETAPRGVRVVGSAATGSAGRPAPLWFVPGPEDESFVDLQRDATVGDIRRAVDAGLRDLEHVKRYTTIGTGADQGATGGLAAAGVTAALIERQVGDLGPISHRAPSAPVTFAALAGTDTGRLADPVRTTAIHSAHVGLGAVFEDVGQWKRPRYYPAEGEDMDAAVLRECTAARTGVAVMDASTLGKIEVAGPDAGEFLDRVYTNAFAKLKVGSARYGVMCTVDGMVLDDGVTMRLADDRFLMSTTTGGAAKVLDHLEEWLQTEWPGLDVSLTSVTEQWVTIAVVGPGSRSVVAGLAPTLDVGREAFPFMTFRDTGLRDGIPARVARISFSGELAYEINVSAWYGLAVWEAVRAAGATPYGTEAMHVLRAEKAFPIVGQDTDGTVTPEDLGMGWVVSKTKDFVGRRSLARAGARRPDRRHLVALLPEDPEERLPEGAQLVADGTPLDVVPVPMLGFVTSSYRSAALGRTFALALVSGGRDRIGERLLAPLEDRVVPAVVHEPVLYDPEGARRDG